MQNIKIVTLQRAEEIIFSSNPNFKWFYVKYENNKNIFIDFFCKNCYRKYRIILGKNEQSICLVSHIVSLFKEYNFHKKTIKN